MYMPRRDHPLPKNYGVHKACECFGYKIKKSLHLSGKYKIFFYFLAKTFASFVHTLKQAFIYRYFIVRRAASSQSSVTTHHSPDTHIR